MDSPELRFYPGLQYSDRDDALRLDVLAPQRAPGDALLPVAIYFHGGGWHEGDRGAGMHPWLNPLLACRGYVTVSVTYRLTPGAQWPAQYDDARHALSWVVDHAANLGGDPARVGVWGFSAGAHLAAHLAVREPELVKAAALAACPVQLQASTTEQPNEVTCLMGASPTAEAMVDVSPLSWIGPGIHPVLIVHGTEDDVVDFAQAITLRDTLRAAGTDVEMIEISGAGHEWADAPGSPGDPNGDFGSLTARFFDRVL